MPSGKKAKLPRCRSKSYRFDPETVGLLDRLGEAMRDPLTGQPRSQTDILREGVRALARKYLAAREKNPE